MNRPLTVGTVTLAALLAACGSTPTTPPELLAARAAVQSAGADPQVLAHAPLELHKAGDALRRADELSAKGRSLADVESAAYVARLRAETATAVAKAKVDEDAIKRAEAERERARAEARVRESERARTEADAARREASTARAEADDAAARAEAARQAAANAQARAAALHQQLAELQAKPTDRGTLVTLGDVLFEFGRADIKTSAQQELQKLAAYLNERADSRVLIEGFTDSVGSEAANLALSQRRADAVAAALVRLGVHPARIATRGYGASFPVATNDSDTNRALNRRVEVYVSDDDRPVRARG